MALYIAGVQELTAPTSTEVEPSPQPSPAQERTAVYRHSEREKIEALLRRGKSADWIALWLEELYPLEDEEGEPHPEVAQHRKRQLRPEIIESYRRNYLPEFAPGFDLLTPELEDAIGRRFPAPQSPVFETEVVEAGIRAAEINLARGLAADEEMEMLQPTTLQAQAQLIDAASASVDIKARLGVPGYEPPPEHVVVDQTMRSMSVEFQGRIDPATGQVVANESKKVQLLEQLMALPPERASQVIEAAKAASAPVVDAEVVEGDESVAVPSATVDSTATEIPDGAELEIDAGAGQGEDRPRPPQSD